MTLTPHTVGVGFLLAAKAGLLMAGALQLPGPGGLAPLRQVRNVETQSDSRGYWLGLHVTAADSALRSQLELESAGLVVRNVSPGSPAGLAGLQRDDLLLEAGTAGNSVTLSTRLHLEAALTTAIIHESPIRLRLLRGGRLQEIDVLPAERPQLHFGTAAATTAE